MRYQPGRLLLARDGTGWHVWRVNEQGTPTRRDNPWWRVAPSVLTGRLVAHHLLGGRLYGLHEAALRWRGRPLKTVALLG
jgi:hypothetical protein